MARDDLNHHPEEPSVESPKPVGNFIVDFWEPQLGLSIDGRVPPSLVPLLGGPVPDPLPEVLLWHWKPDPSVWLAFVFVFRF